MISANLSQAPSKNKNAELIRILMPVIVIIILILVGGKLLKSIKDAIKAPFEGLGIMNTDEENKAIETAEDKIKRMEASPNNPFNPGYISKLMTEYKRVSILNVQLADGWAKQIYDAIGSVYDSPEQIFAAIKNCQAKSHVSYLANVFQKKYNKDLLTWLIQKMDTTEQKIILGKIIEYVNGLPTGGKN